MTNNYRCRISSVSNVLQGALLIILLNIEESFIGLILTFIDIYDIIEIDNK